MAQLLTEAEIEQSAKLISGWAVEGAKLQTICKFQDFMQAIEFVK